MLRRKLAETEVRLLDLMLMLVRHCKRKKERGREKQKKRTGEQDENET